MYKNIPIIYIAKSNGNVEQRSKEGPQDSLNYQGLRQARQLAAKMHEEAVPLIDKAYSSSDLNDYAAAVIISYFFAADAPVMLELLNKSHSQKPHEELHIRARSILNYFQEKHYSDQFVLITCSNEIGQAMYYTFYGLEDKSEKNTIEVQSAELIVLSNKISYDAALIFKSQNSLA